MKKKIRLKRWVSILEAATYLSTVLEENVTEADVLLMALDGHLELALQLPNGAYAKRLERVNEQEVEYITVPSLVGAGTVTFPKNGPLFKDKDGTFHQVLRDTIYQLENDLWALRIYGGARLDIEHRFHLLTGGPEVTLVNLDGDVFVDDTRGNLYQLYEHFEDNESFPRDKLKTPYNHTDNYYPAGGIPKDSVLVVLTSELARFEASLSETEAAQEKPLGTTERTSLLTIIAALAKAAGIDISKPSKAALSIESLTDQIKAPVAKRTIEEHLKRIPDALERRIKS